jgi:SAM-dependent methyltransferase
MDEQEIFLTLIQESIDRDEFVKTTISKPAFPSNDLVNVYVKKVMLKDKPNLSLNYRYKTNDQVKNFTIETGVKEVDNVLQDLRNAVLFTTKSDYTFQKSKKGKGHISRQKASFNDIRVETHDRVKQKRAEKSDDYLQLLGITDKEGKVIPKMADKYRQINKYLEVIEGLIKSTTLPKKVSIVDMGSGKGYLTFALYDYLHNKLNLSVNVTGIELRQELVDYCNKVANKAGFEQLTFACQRIETFDNDQIDILIALHACDTATDDAIYKGIVSDSALIICAPCCHKQIRQQLKGKEQTDPILKHGIFKERQYEMVTDTIRALIMEKKQYQTKIFEFVSNEHTRKNVLLVGAKTDKTIDEASIDEKIDQLKQAYGIEEHYLEGVLK